MPEMDGFELCRQIRATETWKNIPIAFLTARRTTQDVKIGMEAGGNDFITKPFDGKTLLGRVERWMPKPQVFRLKSAVNATTRLGDDAGASATRAIHPHIVRCRCRDREAHRRDIGQVFRTRTEIPSAAGLRAFAGTAQHPVRQAPSARQYDGYGDRGVGAERCDGSCCAFAAALPVLLSEPVLNLVRRLSAVSVGSPGWWL